MTIIDKETWPRRAHYDFFTPMSDPFYTLTFPVDVTPLRAWCRGRSLPFYPAMVFAVTKAMEAVDAFHYKDRDGVIVRHDTLVPSFTDLKPGSELFQIVQECALECEVWKDEAFVKANEESYEKLKEQGVTIVELTDEEMELWTQASEAIWDEFVGEGKSISYDFIEYVQSFA